MKSTTALIISVASAAVAVGIVSVDLAFTLVSAIDVREEGSWVAVQTDPYSETTSRPRTLYGPGCYTNDLRIRIDNNRPIDATVDVLVRYSSDKGTGSKILEETWSLGAFEERTFEFKVPDEAFPNATEAVQPTVSVEAHLGGRYPLYVCVVKGGSA